MIDVIILSRMDLAKRELHCQADERQDHPCIFSAPISTLVCRQHAPKERRFCFTLRVAGLMQLRRLHQRVRTIGLGTYLL